MNLKLVYNTIEFNINKIIVLFDIYAWPVNNHGH